MSDALDMPAAVDVSDESEEEMKMEQQIDSSA